MGRDEQINNMSSGKGEREMGIEIIGECDHYVPYGYSSRAVKRKVGKCVCGREVQLLEFTNTCVCGRDYNMSGQLLAARTQWGTETGESASDILRAGHHVEE